MVFAMFPARMSVCLYVSMSVCLYLCMYVSMYVSMYVCMYVLGSYFRPSTRPYLSCPRSPSSPPPPPPRGMVD